MHVMSTPAGSEYLGLNYKRKYLENIKKTPASCKSPALW